MKVKNIVNIVNKLLSLNIATELIECNKDGSTQSAVNSDKQLSLVIDCINYTIDQLACQCAPNTYYQEVIAEGGKISYEQLKYPPLEVMSLTDSFGTNVPFRYVVGGIAVECNGRMGITYSTPYDKVDLWTDINLSNNKLTERAIAYGACAEYCLLTADYSMAQMWQDRYNQAVEIASYKRSEKRIKGRRWL